MRASRLTAVIMGLLPLAPAAWAADATPEQARSLERQVREWMISMAGPVAKLADRPVQITPDGDHYTVAIPVGSAVGGNQPMLTATARMADGGKWNIDAIRFPTPAQFTIDLPQPPKAGDKSPVGMAPVTYKVTLDQQSGQVLYDPSYASPSTLNSSFQGLNIQASGAQVEQTSHVDRSATTSTLRPAGTDRVDVVTDGTIEGYTIASKAGDAETLKMSMQRVRITGELSSVSRDRAAQVLQALIQISATMGGASKAAAGGAPAPKLDDKAMRTLLQAMADFASGMTLDETIDKLAVSYGDFGGTANQARFGFSAKTEQGILQARLDLGMEGLALPDLPLGDMAVLIPSKVALRPVVSGVAMADLMRIANNSGEGKSPAPADIAALFSKGGISTGLESFSIDMAGSSFTGMGKLLFTSPEQFSGTAQVTATNLDLLQQQVATMPALANVVPVFIFAKGIGRTVENRMVWDITYRDGRLLVNSQDLTAMTGGTPPPPARPTPGPNRPQQPNRTR